MKRTIIDFILCIKILIWKGSFIMKKENIVKLNCILENGWNLKINIQRDIVTFVSERHLFWDSFDDILQNLQLRAIILESIRDFNFIHSNDCCKITSLQNDAVLRAMVAYSLRIWIDINNLDIDLHVDNYETEIPSFILDEIKTIVNDNFFKSFFPNLHYFYVSALSFDDFNYTELLPIYKAWIQLFLSKMDGSVLSDNVEFQSALLAQKIRMAFEELCQCLENKFPSNKAFMRNINRNLDPKNKNKSRFNSVVFPNGVTIDGFDLVNLPCEPKSNNAISMLYPRIRSVIENFNKDNQLFDDKWIIDTVTRLIVIRLMTGNITPSGTLVLDKNETTATLNYHSRFIFDEPEYTEKTIDVLRIVNDDGSAK